MIDEVPAGRDKVVNVKGKRLNLVTIAESQRLAITMAAVFCVGYVLFLVPRLNPGGTIPGTEYVRIAGLLCYITGWIGGVIATIRLARATGSSILLCILGGLLMLLPLYGVVALALANRRATVILELHNVEVGFLGLSKDELSKLREGACAGCGYDVRGLNGPTCPECGVRLREPVGT